MVVLACGLTLAACGGSDDDKDVGQLKIPPDFNIQLFNCTDWQKADEPLRRYVLKRYRDIVGGDVTGRGTVARGSVLPDSEARRLFDNYCSQHFARAFTLYKLYGQAAGFTGAQPPER